MKAMQWNGHASINPCWLDANVLKKDVGMEAATLGYVDIACSDERSLRGLAMPLYHEDYDDDYYVAIQLTQGLNSICSGCRQLMLDIASSAIVMEYRRRCWKQLFITEQVAERRPPKNDEDSGSDDGKATEDNSEHPDAWWEVVNVCINEYVGDNGRLQFDICDWWINHETQTVSYTHLTLPTKRIV